MIVNLISYTELNKKREIEKERMIVNLTSYTELKHCVTAQYSELKLPVLSKPKFKGDFGVFALRIVSHECQS